MTTTTDQSQQAAPRCTCGAREFRGCFCGLTLAQFLAAHPDRTY